MIAPAAPPRPADNVLGDLDTLLCAVKGRLRSLADGVDRPFTADSAQDAEAHLRSGVLDCVGALQQLHTMLAREIIRRRRLDQVVTDAEAALARAPPELVARLGISLRLPVADGPEARAQ